MPTYRLLGAFRAVAEMPVPHVHLIAVGSVEETSSETVPTMSWTARDLETAEPRPCFVVGPTGVTVPADVSAGPCSECGERVVRVFPAEMEHALPECQVG